LERLSAPQEPAYDAGELRARFDEVTAHDRDWRQWFAASEIDPLRIAYEELSADPVETLRVVLDRLGLGRSAADGIEVGVAKLADDTNRDWVARFRAEQVQANPA
jgi:LPS sulfotransferase NodH